MEIVTFNCQGLRSSDHRETLFSWLNCTNVDFLCLQETHSVSQREFSSWLHDAVEAKVLSKPYDCVSSPGTNRSSSVAIVYKSHFELSTCATDPKGCFVCGNFSTETNSFQICTIYGPNTSKEGGPFFDSLYPVLDPGIPCILCGNFNTVVNASTDRRGCNAFSLYAYNWSDTLSALMSCYNLKDVWRLWHPIASEFTWHRANGSLQASRLDMFWLCSFFLPLVLSVDIFPFFRSDHSYVYLRLSLPTSVHRGPGVWKLNTSHLKDLSFLLLVTQFWESWRNEKRSFHNLSAWWDAGKSHLKLLIRNFSRKKASAFRKRISSLERTLYFLNRRTEHGEDVDHLLTDVRSELEDAHRQQAKGCQIRANVQWAEEGEASTSYFFKLEQRHGQSRLFSGIRTAGGSVVSSFVLIARAWVFFYVTLFSADVLHVGHQDFFLSHIIHKLSPEQRAFCDGELTAEEFKRALDDMVYGRSPGLDGFPAEIYQTFWPVLGQDFVKVILTLEAWVEQFFHLTRKRRSIE